jgi:tRNA G18 (ribose-2'-O)-methylase SpoU
VIVRIDESTDSRLADYRNVPDPELIERGGIFVAEGRLVVRRLLEGGRLRARSVMLTDSAYAALQDAIERHPALHVYIVPQPVMDAITGFNIHRGCLAIGERPAPQYWNALVRGASTLEGLDRIGNADNVGSIFRNAAAFGADAVLLGPGCTDPLYRKAIRTSMAAALTIPFAAAVPWPSMLAELRSKGVAMIGMTPDMSAPPLDRVRDQLRGGNPFAIVVGHEGDGLSREALDECDRLARIQMAAGVDSVNVATAVAIALYELRAVRGDTT